MMRNMMWILSSAIVAVALGRWIELFQLGDPQLWIAAAIGGGLALAAVAGVEPESVLQQKTALPARFSTRMVRA
jgi:hypothetical protein